MDLSLSLSLSLSCSLTLSIHISLSLSLSCPPSLPLIGPVSHMHTHTLSRLLYVGCLSQLTV